ncbi:hypothetical protein LOK49_LG07G00055 [Camellia lanceoleosa]|uniref:Uncharacterized protein n=1 Tax=Camellia lanceoleosa TaxID=1840588 RepID=A0ACC0H091_9ERIC|nr:hypothetical protein LOK49_LG07G00055 [Camellia lanceoleosa]
MNPPPPLATELGDEMIDVVEASGEQPWQPKCLMNGKQVEDDEQKMVLVDSDDIWLNYVRRVPDAKGMRNRPFPFYEDWLILFGKDRATGELAKDPANAVAAMEKEDANATIEEREQSPVE